MVAWLRATIDPAVPALLAGDFNVTPDDRDVHDPELWRGRNLASEPERERLRAVMGSGLVDLGRHAAGDIEGPFTFWDYRMGAFHRGWGCASTSHSALPQWPTGWSRSRSIARNASRRRARASPATTLP